MAENLGGNRFKVQTENVRRFRIYLAPQMGDLTRPFTVEFADGTTVTADPSPISGIRDYTAVISLQRVLEVCWQPVTERKTK